MARGLNPGRIFPLDPAAAVLHYAQEIFEGLKAYKRDNGVNLFRPDANARRFRNSAERMAMVPCPSLCSSKRSSSSCASTVPGYQAARAVSTCGPS